jgi:hypothetical protein
LALKCLEAFSRAAETEWLAEANMNSEQRLELAVRGTVEIIQRPELQRLLEEKSPRAYWGFECSGTRGIACTE